MDEKLEDSISPTSEEDNIILDSPPTRILTLDSFWKEKFKKHPKQSKPKSPPPIQRITTSISWNRTTQPVHLSIVNDSNSEFLKKAFSKLSPECLLHVISFLEVHFQVILTQLAAPSLRHYSNWWTEQIEQLVNFQNVSTVSKALFHPFRHFCTKYRLILDFINPHWIQTFQSQEFWCWFRNIVSHATSDSVFTLLAQLEHKQRYSKQACYIFIEFINIHLLNGKKWKELILFGESVDAYLKTIESTWNIQHRQYFREFWFRGHIESMMESNYPNKHNGNSPSNSLDQLITLWKELPSEMIHLLSIPVSYGRSSAIFSECFAIKHLLEYESSLQSDQKPNKLILRQMMIHTTEMIRCRHRKSIAFPPQEYIEPFIQHVSTYFSQFLFCVNCMSVHLFENLSNESRCNGNDGSTFGNHRLSPYDICFKSGILESENCVERKHYIEIQEQLSELFFHFE